MLKESKVQMFRADHLSNELRKRKGSSVTVNDTEDPFLRPMTSVAASRKLVEERGLQFSDDDGDSSGTDYEENDVLNIKKDLGFKPVKGQPGMFYKVCNLYCHINKMQLVGFLLRTNQLIENVEEGILNLASDAQKSLLHSDYLLYFFYRAWSIYQININSPPGRSISAFIHSSGVKI